MIIAPLVFRMRRVEINIVKNIKNSYAPVGVGGTMSPYKQVVYGGVEGVMPQIEKNAQNNGATHGLRNGATVVGLRIPLAITQSLSRKRDPLSRKIVEAHANETRKEWGPEIVPTPDELVALEEIATNIKKDRSAPMKMVSAANKLLESIAKFRLPPQPAPTPPAVSPGPAQTSQALDEVLGKLLSSESQNTPQQVYDAQMSAPNAPPAGFTTHHISSFLRLLDRETRRRSPKEAAHFKVEIVLDLLRHERPLLATLLEEVLVDISNI